MKTTTRKSEQIIKFIALLIFFILVAAVKCTSAQSEIILGYPDTANYEVVEIPEPRWKFNSLGFSTGETALTKGNTFSSSFSRDKLTLILDYNKDLGEAIIFYKVDDRFSVGPSFGFFKNTPWFAPIASLSFFEGHLTTLHWIGWSLGNPETTGTDAEIAFCFSYQKVSLNGFGFETSYAHQIYQQNPEEHIFDLKKNIPLNDFFTVFVSGGYMLRAEKFLWATGLTLNLN